MRILIAKGIKYSEQSIRTGYYNACDYLGYTSKLWDKTLAFEEIDRFKPDAIIIGNNELNNEITRRLSESSNIQVILDVNQEFYPYHTSPCIHIKNIKYYTHQQKYANELTPYILPAFDSIKFPKGEYKDYLDSEFSYIGFADKEKRKKILYYINKGCKVKIYGYGQWNLPQYIGAIKSPKIFADVITSSRFNLNFTNTINEQLFKIIGCGGLCEVKTEWNLDLSDFYNKHTYIQRIKEIL